MIRIPILPTSLMSYNYEDPYLLVLAHLYEVDEEYTNHVHNIRDRGAYIILDNGVIEGDQRPADELIGKALRLKANEVVLPDAFCNYALNRAFFLQHYLNFREKLPGVRLMMVIHGSTYAEYMMQLHFFAKAGVDVIGIPKVMSLFNVDRNEFILSIRSLDLSHVQYHFLGCNKGMEEIERAEKIGIVRSVDSAFPYVQAKVGCSLYDERSTTINIAFDDVNDDPEFLDRLSMNLVKWRSTCNVRTVPTEPLT